MLLFLNSLFCLSKYTYDSFSIHWKLNEFIGKTNWVDVCQSDSNLLVSGGSDKSIKIYDHRIEKISKTFDNIHAGKENFCFYYTSYF